MKVGIQVYGPGHSEGIRGAFNGHSSPKTGHSANFGFGGLEKPRGLDMFCGKEHPRVHYYNIRGEETRAGRRRGESVKRQLSRILHGRLALCSGILFGRCDLHS